MLKDSATDSFHGAPAGFQHDAFVYASDEEFVGLAVPLVQDGLAAGEDIVAVLPPERIALLREALGAARDQVAFIDMTVAGGNPARLIPLWRDALERQPGRPVRGLAETAYPGRSAAGYDEVLLHEALTDIAFADDRSFRLYCAYEASVGID
ncbi:MAG TPA: MEDS domain-containing protein, partial [Kribbella sp.]|nr:MEDS domain-containing protein [Kribbella sp.]